MIWLFCEFHENVKKYMYVVQTNHGVHASDSILQWEGSSNFVYVSVSCLLHILYQI